MFLRFASAALLLLTASCSVYEASLLQPASGPKPVTDGAVSVPDTATPMPDGARETTTPPADVADVADVTPSLVFVRAIDIGGTGGVIDGVKFEPSGTTPEYFTTAPMTQTFPTPSALKPPVNDPTKSEMIHSSAWGSDFEVDLEVPLGPYQVYAYVWQHDVVTAGTPVKYNVSVGIDQVVTDADSGTYGDWAKLGPWATKVVGATITVRLWTGTNSRIFISGLEVWKEPP